MRIRDLVLAVLALTWIVSCSTSGRTYEIDESVQRPSEQPLLDIARAVKEFSGYYCEDGNFVVGLVRLDAAIKQAVTERLEPGMATYCGASSTLVFVEKKHSFLSLRAWRDTINLEYFEIDGAVSLGISYTENRIVLGVESRGRDAAHELVRDYELPSDGYVILEEGPVIPE